MGNNKFKEKMNVSSTGKKVYSKLRHLQIEEDDLNADNFSEAAYRAGQYDMAKFFIKLYDGELNNEQVEIELAKLEPTEAVN